jgi:hypothetical protein
LRYILAVDRGGTKCDALLVAEDGTVAGRGRCDYSHPESGRGWGGSGRTEQNRSRAVRQSLETWRGGDSLTLVGDTTLAPGDLPAGVDCPIHRRRASEQDIGLALLRDEPGIVALVGTGALLIGRAPKGRVEIMDGLGPALGDYGSAYHIGSLAMRAAARAHWRPRHRTTLAQVVPEACSANVGSPPDFNLIAYSLEHRDRSEIAALAALVDREARAGDAVSQRILAETAGALAENVRDLRDALGEPAATSSDRMDRILQDVPGTPGQGEAAAPAEDPEGLLVGAGSVIAGSDSYWQELAVRVREFAPGMRAVRIRQPAIIGYVLLAARESGWPNAENLPDMLFPP